MNEGLDTFLNVTVFAFIGLLIWLYLKPERPGPDNEQGPHDN